jgi:hypothetical protein
MKGRLEKDVIPFRNQQTSQRYIFNKIRATRVVPVNERGITKWNSNPYRYVLGGNGTTEDDGAAWLLPYWMDRYHGFILEK